MAIRYFNDLLRAFSIKPSDVILIRHADGKSDVGRDPYSLWLTDRNSFMFYQSIQKATTAERTKFSRPPFWASFVRNYVGETLFVGVYISEYSSVLAENVRALNRPSYMWEAGKYDLYKQVRDERFSKYEGKLFIEWGGSPKSWVQRAEKQNKIIINYEDVHVEDRSIIDDSELVLK